MRTDTAPTTAGPEWGARPESPPSGPVRRRIPFLDVARGWAMIGVVLMNAGMFAATAEAFGNTEGGPGTTAVNAAATLLFSERSRELLMLLLGIGAVLTWLSAARRGERPGWLLVRRYAVLFAVFGLAHWYVFDGDILTHYSLAAVVLVALLPLLLTGARWRPLALAAALLPLSAALQAAVPHLLFDAQFGVSTLAAFAIGVWLARLPGGDGGTAVSGIDGGEASVRTLAVRLSVWGVALSVAGVLALGGITLAFPRQFDAEGMPLPRTAVETALGSLSGDVLLIGGALLYFGLVWWLVDRGRTAARALGALAPLGQMSLTVYLGSTAVFLLTLDGHDGELSELTHLGIASGYVLVMALVCSLWLRFFRYGPAEWLWRCLTYLRPLPIRRHPTAGEPG
ncbi:uncharacterized protein F4561_004584 [Lipingzhangella halophila]|uniref:DUF418 domain-containing protein n=1 Tax=Lipingzhangella halophila TaxID=1783352 RepID=A0A7W7W5E5_9ACTN|nr:DUF418 domain-containing protein [Lipingzhangella halophila]MBB4933764.1 uncharacterized protein [Lipingzhangella halophila]